MSIGIYIIRNKINDKIYIGRTIDIDRRCKAHYNMLNRNDHCNEYLQADWNGLGKNCFEFITLHECDEDILYDCEEYFISYYNTTDKRYGYNLSYGGYCDYHTNDSEKKRYKALLGRVCSSETKEKIRISNTGKTHTDECKAKLSEAHKGSKHWRYIPRTEEMYKMSLVLTGTQFSKRFNVSTATFNRIKRKARKSIE